MNKNSARKEDSIAKTTHGGAVCEIKERCEDLLCPTFRTTFMPCVAHTPPLMLSSP